jgi:excisionase family DNA binding protein
MTTREVAALFARSPRTIRNWVRAGHLHPVRIGGAVFFRPEEVEALAGRRS